MAKGGPKPPKGRVLADHKRVGKKFVPPMAQWSISETQWPQRLLPEFLWLALLNRSLGHARGVEVARLVAAAACQIGGTSWYAPMSAFDRVTEQRREPFVSLLRDAGIAGEVRRSLAALATSYPACPLNLGVEEGDAVDLNIVRQQVAEMLDRTTVTAMRAQAAALYLAFDAKLLRLSGSTMLAEFPEVQHYPTTEKSRLVASAVRAALNGMTIRITDTSWPAAFWNRGLELAACRLAEDDE
jgi:hypothetical protein